MAQGDAREGKWSGNWQMEWVASTLHTTSEHDVFTITTADAHTSAASSRLNWCPRRFIGLLHFAERRNLVSARVPSHFKRSLQNSNPPALKIRDKVHSRTSLDDSSFNLIPKWGVWMVRAMPLASSRPTKRPCTHCTGGWNPLALAKRKQIFFSVMPTHSPQNAFCMTKTSLDVT